MEASNGEGRASIIGSTGTIDLYPTQRQQDEAVDLTGCVHHLPCCIKYNGPSDVSNYFKPKSFGSFSKLPCPPLFLGFFLVLFHAALF